MLDDSVDTIALIATFLRHKGYRVLTSGDGKAGIELALERQPDIVITDMLMPGASGFRVIDRLKSTSDWRPAIIMISANDAPLHRAYASALGADDFLPKPFCLQQLFDSVRRLCPTATEPLDDATHTDANALIVT